MRKHVIQFEVQIPDKMTDAELQVKLKAILDLLEHKTSNLQLDPQPQIIRIPVPRDDQAVPAPYQPPYQPYQPKPERPQIGDLPWKPSWKDDFYKYEAYRKPKSIQQNLDTAVWKSKLAKIDELAKS